MHTKSGGGGGGSVIENRCRNVFQQYELLSAYEERSKSVNYEVSLCC